MSRIKYYYDPKTCKYERYVKSKWDVTLNVLGFLSLSSILAVGILIVFHYYFDSPKELILKRERKEMTTFIVLFSNPSPFRVQSEMPAMVALIDLKT